MYVATYVRLVGEVSNKFVVAGFRSALLETGVWQSPQATAFPGLISLRSSEARAGADP